MLTPREIEVQCSFAMLCGAWGLGSTNPRGFSRTLKMQRTPSHGCPRRPDLENPSPPPDQCLISRTLKLPPKLFRRCRCGGRGRVGLSLKKSDQSPSGHAFPHTSKPPPSGCQYHGRDYELEIRHATIASPVYSIRTQERPKFATP